MAVATRRRGWGERESSEISPERTKVWMEPKQKPLLKKVPVVYYLTRNGHLEHPHFMEVPLSSGDGLYLRDVINRLSLLRGKGMASLYSWSSKRSYKNGFVWHDLTEDDFIYPAHGTEYVLKGSELLQLQENSSPSRSQDTTTSATSSSGSEKEMIPKSSRDDTDFPMVRRKESRWSSFDLGEYKVYKTESTTDVANKASDASTQTDERRQWRRTASSLPRDDGQKKEMDEKGNSPVQLGRNDISPPSSSSSPEIIDDLIKADLSRNAVELDLPVDDQDRTVGMCPSGRARASAVLFNLISCGTISVKEHQGNGLPFVPHYRPKPPRCDLATNPTVVGKEAMAEEESRSFPTVKIEDKEYFSGSLIETKKKASDVSEELPSLKRSSSYNADRSSKLDIEEEVENVRAKCIPRKPKTGSMKKETSSFVSRSTHGSKRITEEVQIPK